MAKSILFVIFAALAIWSIARANQTKFPPRYLLAAFWGLIALNQTARSPLLLVAAVACLGGYWLWVFVRRNTSKHELQKGVGWADAAMAAIEAKPIPAGKEVKSLSSEKEIDEELADRAYRAHATLQRVKVDAVQPAEQGFPADESGSLISLPGPVSLELEMERLEWNDGIVAYRSRTMVCDNEGTEWQCETFCRVGIFLSALDGVETRELPSWEKAPAAFVEAIRSQCVLAELTELLDSRDYHEVSVDGRKFEYLEKYQMPTVDIAWLAGQKCWVVRVKGIYRDVHGEETDLDEMPNIPPFVLTCPAETGLVLVDPEVHACDPEEWLDDERGRPVFSKTGRQGIPQGTVVFRPEPFSGE